jgi:putative acetyltransferase
VLTLRAESPEDQPPIFRVNREAFGRDAEARLVDALRASPAFIPDLSLVALEGSEPVGHVLFTRLTIRDAGAVHRALALAPLAVLPRHQNRGVGSALVRRGLEEARRLGHGVVIVVGHPSYYPRFGFQPAEPLGLRAPFEVRADAFLVLGLHRAALHGVRGDVEYPPEFDRV